MQKNGVANIMKYAGGFIKFVDYFDEDIKKTKQLKQLHKTHSEMVYKPLVFTKHIFYYYLIVFLLDLAHCTPQSV